jgi:nitrilase
MATGPNVGANLMEAERLIAEAAEAGARLAVLPENFAFMGATEREQRELAETPDGGRLQDFLAQISSRYGMWLVGGTIPMRGLSPDKLRASCLVFDDGGERVGRYDKIHLFDVHLVESDERYIESETFEAGNGVTVLDSPFGRLGIAVCYDLRFPELFRRMLDEGVEMFAVPSAFTAITGRAHWHTLIRARAMENLAYVVAAAQGGYHYSGRETYGHSMIVDPWGTVLSEARGTGAVTCLLDRSYLETTRRTFPSIDHRRLKCN